METYSLGVNMPVFRMRQLGGVGVVTDLPSFDLPPNAWTKALNVRFFGNKIQKMGGNIGVVTQNMPDVTPISICQRPNTKSIIYGTNNKIYRTEGNFHYDCTRLNVTVPVPYTATPKLNWYYTWLSNSVIMNNVNDVPQGLVPGSNFFIDLPNWGFASTAHTTLKYWRTPRIRTFKDYLICLGMYEGADSVNNTWYPQRIRWSDVSFIDNLPSNWHEDDPNSDGGFVDLSNAIGTVVDGVAMADKFIIYTDRETYMMDYVGGDFIFNFRKIFSDAGILAPECAVEFEGQHFVISQDDIFVHNGSTRQSCASGRIKDYLLNEISSTNPQATKVFAYPKRKEIWIQYVSPGSSSDNDDPIDPDSYACDKVAVWNYESDTWSFYEIAKSFDINICTNTNDTDKNWSDYWNESSDEWDNAVQEAEVWNTQSQTFKRQILMSASKDKKVYALDVGNYFNYKMNNISYKRPMYSIIERRAIDFDESVEDISRHKMITKLTPQISGYGTLKFEIGGSNYPDDAPIYEEQMLYKLGEDDRVDCFVNYRYPSIKITDSSISDWNLTSIDVTFLLEGTR